MPADAAIVVVNYNSGEYLPGCLRSLRPELQDGVRAEVVVVENASPRDQSAALALAEAEGATVLRAPRNLGYAGGLNLGLARTRAPIVFLVNPDVVARAGALARLLRHLAEHPEVGLAEPRYYVDAGLTWKQPDFPPITPLEIVRGALGRSFPGYDRWRQLRGLRHQIHLWEARDVRARPALTGAFLAARRKALDALGGLDEGFTLGYEDTDLSASLREAGWTLACVPEAEVIHFGHRSRMTELEASVAKDRLGRRRYLEKHHGRAAVWLDRFAEWLETRLRRWQSPVAPPDVLDLGRRSTAPELELTGAPGPYVLLLTRYPSLAPAMGHLGVGARLRMSAATWSSLPPFPLYARAFDLESLAPRGAWRWERLEVEPPDPPRP